MVSSRVTFVALAAACIAAAGVGGYIAVRQTASPTPLAAATPLAPAVPLPSSLQKSAAAGPVGQAEPAADSLAPPATQAVARAAARERALRAPSSSGLSNAAAPLARGEVPLRAARGPASSAATASNEQAAPASSSPVDRPEANSQAPMAPPVPPSSLATDASTPSVVTDARADEHAAFDPPSSVPEPPAPSLEELVVPMDSVIGLQTEMTISSESARVEDRVDAHVNRDVRVHGRVAISSGTRAIGSVTQVERGGKFKERAHLSVRFHTLVLPDGTRVPISTETITRDGEAPASAPKIGGGAVAGAILGAILGGSKGAAIGGAAGAGAGVAAAAAADSNAAVLYAGESITVRMRSAVTVTAEK